MRYIEYWFQTSPTDRHSLAKQSDGAVVAHALPHAQRVPVPQGVQGVVFKPRHGHDRGQLGV